MSGTRAAVLKNLLDQQRCTIIELAEAVEINPISVRHHITRLEEEGLVDSQEERHGVGRPRRVYYLTEKGIEQFPTRTLHFTNQLLALIKSDLPEETLDQLLQTMATSLTQGACEPEELETLTLDERLSLLESCLTREGFSVVVERDLEAITIKETTCPYYHVGQTHAEVCSIDKTLISRLLSVAPERTTCLLDGDSHCTYVVPMTAITEAVN
jgi:predicted ArsR family transcriptional regulator